MTKVKKEIREPLLRELLGLLLLQGGVTYENRRDGIDAWIDAHDEDIWWPAINRGYVYHSESKERFTITPKGRKFFEGGSDADIPIAVPVPESSADDEA